jgi:NADH:ubiquinone oxidoreductase subunit 6 (subunit J)
MNLFALSPMQLAGGQIALAAVLAVVGFGLLLPMPRGRSVTGGIAALIAAAAVLGVYLYRTFGDPLPDTVGSVLFWLFSAGAVGFGTVLVTQRNPARGAIAFAFVILSTCGLFLLLAATFLMAATIIIYAGAIIVTFLFVLMLSQTGGPSDENDRSREPWFGGLAGFAFTGLVLFTLYVTQVGGNPAKAEEGAEAAKPAQRLPLPVLTAEERNTLVSAAGRLAQADEHLAGETTPPAGRDGVIDFFERIKADITGVVGSNERPDRVGSLRRRMEVLPRRPGEALTSLRTDEQTDEVFDRARNVRELNERAYDAVYNSVMDDRQKRPRTEVRAELRALRGEVLLLAGAGELPARNVGNLGYVLYTQHLLGVELAGTLLLVATIGAVAIVQRKGAVQ